MSIAIRHPPFDTWVTVTHPLPGVDELDRGGLLEELLGRDAIGRALAEAPGSGRYESALNANMTLVCALVGCLFPGVGYDQVLARAFGIPGLRFWPGPVPTASALSQARERLGEHAVRRLSSSMRRRATRSSG